MSFLTPWIAVWIASAVIPALLILYFLKLRRREEVVASTLLWKRAVQDLQVNAPFQRLRRNLLLLLQLLVVSAAILALARPVVQTGLARQESVVILLDRSGSMNAQEGERTRLDLAKEQAVRLARSLNRAGSRWLRFAGAGGETQAMVIAFADRASVVSPFTTNTAELVSLIEAIEPSDAPTSLSEGLALAEAYMTRPIEAGVGDTPVGTERPSTLVVISDGGIADADELFLRYSSVEFIPVGEARENVGITALRVARNYERPERVDAFLRVENFGPSETRRDVAVLVDGTLRVVETVRLAAGRRQPERGPQTRPAREEEPASGAARAVSFPLTLDRAGLLEVRLAPVDALKADDRAFAVVPSPRKLRVLLVSRGNYFLESVLAGLPLEEVAYLTPEQYESAPAARVEAQGHSLYDVVILDKHSTKRLAGGNYLFFGSVPLIDGVRAGGEVAGQALMWWDETHALLRNVELDYVHVAGWLELELPEQAQTLVEGPAGPVMARYARDGRHYLLVAFAVEHSTWWQHPSFPVFMYNALRYLGSAGGGEGGATLRPGETLRAPLPAGRDQATLEKPDGTTVTIRPDETGVARFSGTERVGVYRVRGGIEGRDAFAVNLEDANESDIAPRGVLRVGAQSIAAREGVSTDTPEVWRWFVGLALLIVFVEWYVYNRRVVI